MQINIKDCIENSLQKHVLSLKFVTYQGEETIVKWKKLGRKRKGEEANMVETE